MQKLNIIVSPRSSKNEIIGDIKSGEIKVKLTAPPVDGEANKKLIALLSKEFDIAKSKIIILKGKNSRQKTILIED